MIGIRINRLHHHRAEAADFAGRAEAGAVAPSAPAIQGRELVLMVVQELPEARRLHGEKIRSHLDRRGVRQVAGSTGPRISVSSG